MKYNHGSPALPVVLLLFAALPVFALDTASESSEVSPLFVRGEAASLDAGVDLDAWDQATKLGSSYREFDMNRRLALSLQQDPEDGDVETVTADQDSSAMMPGAVKKNPGRALLLSAIMPGAGELYAGKNLRAAGFFALELGCWVGAIYYAQQGKDKNDEFEKFADVHYSERTYRSTEFNAAVDPTVGEGYTEDESAWANLTWQDKLQYLPDNFTHELPTEHDQQYYENVGKYLTQFGFGWDDQSGDDPTTLYLWDGPKSLHMLSYIDMRAESNKLLDRSATFFMVILANHVVSALDAGFAVRGMNMKAEVEPEVGSIRFNDVQVVTAGVRMTF